MAQLQERGIFRWDHKNARLKAGIFATHAYGQLTIEADGTIKLEIDGRIPGPENRTLERISQEDLHQKVIYGLLQNRKYVMLSELGFNGGTYWSSYIEKHNYVALNCITGDSFPNSDHVSEIEIPLTGLENWIGLDAIEVKRTKTELLIHVRKPDDRRYFLSHGEIIIRTQIHGPGLGQRKTTEAKSEQTYSVTLQKETGYSLAEVPKQCNLVEDFFALLTGQKIGLGWPHIAFSEDKDNFVYHYLKQIRQDTYESYRSPVNFLNIADQFDTLFSRFVELRETVGAGVYLYFSLLNSRPFYSEHRFINLIWGLEAFHRGKFPKRSSAAVKSKIDRILAIADKRDKRWLKQQLRNASEPNLESRLVSLFEKLPIEDQSLRTFCKKCAGYRNDISHFGSHRQGTYSEFVSQLTNLSRALSILYHLLLLQEIGLDEAIIQRYIFAGPQAAINHRDFENAELVLLRPTA